MEGNCSPKQNWSREENIEIVSSPTQDLEDHKSPSSRGKSTLIKTPQQSVAMSNRGVLSGCCWWRELWRDVGALACMMPEDRNAGVRSPGALAAAPFIPKTTYRRIKRCFSFRKGRSALSLCSAVLLKPWLLRSQGGSVCRGRWEHRNKRH